MTLFAMGTPAKKRKLNSDSKASPVNSRSLDYFFGKQKQDPPKASGSATQTISQNDDTSELTDEQLARKLQAEWDQQDAAANETPKEAGADQIEPAADVSNLPERSKRTPTPDVADWDKQEELNEEPKDKKPAPFVFGAKSKNTLSLQSAGTAEDTICSNIPFDESPLTFDPSKYVNDLQGHWAAEGGDASYALLTRCFVLVNSTQSRIKIVNTLVNLLRVIIEGDPSSLLPTVSTVLSPHILLCAFYSHALFLPCHFQIITSDFMLFRSG